MKNMAFLAALGVALGGTAAMAQSPAPQDQQHGAWSNGRRQGDGFGALLKGINLTSAQKTQLQQLRKSDRGAMQQGRNGGQANLRQQIQAARQRGDTVAARQLMAQERSQMEARRDQQIAAIRGILTPDQLAQFDKNVAQMKQRQAQFQAKGRGRFNG
jgi:Spy/CpxP family protein refolding chaperone